MSALGSQTTVDLFPVHHGIKSELLTRAFQTFHGPAPIKPSLLPAPGRNPLSPWLLYWATGLLRPSQSVPLHTGPAARTFSPARATALHSSRGRHSLPRSHVCGAQHGAPGLPTLRASQLQEASPPTAHPSAASLVPIILGSLQYSDTHYLVFP